ncbi:MAG TPA: hypothetical protein ENJ00_06635 [Phycisphaerales bacterium]|nr:hypothetical protein [Phycisphaerales bacterium]
MNARTALALTLASASLMLGGCETLGLGDSASAATAGDLGLSLNNGEKWQLDDISRNAMATLNELVDGAKLDSLESAAALGDKLKATVADMMNTTTLAGAAREQLDTFVGKFTPTLDSLAGAANLEAAQGALAQIKTMLASFNSVFQ